MNKGGSNVEGALNTTTTTSKKASPASNRIGGGGGGGLGGGGGGGGGSARPKAVFFWTNLDVLKWLKRHCAELFPHYCHLFEQHDITGRSLVRMTDNNLERLGISDAGHRDEIWREILKLKLKCDILELRDLQNKNGNLAAN